MRDYEYLDIAISRARVCGAEQGPRCWGASSGSVHRIDSLGLIADYGEPIVIRGLDHGPKTDQ